MPLNIGFTYETNSARHGSPSVRFMPNGTVELWRERAMYPKLEITHTNADHTVTPVGPNYLLWSVVYDNGETLSRCSRCPKEHILGFKRKQPPTKIVEWGSPEEGFISHMHHHENSKHYNPESFRSHSAHAQESAPTGDEYPVIRYRDLGGDGMRQFKAFLGCNSHFHGHHLFHIKCQLVLLDEAGNIIGTEVAYSPRIKVVSKFLEKKGTKALAVEEVREQIQIESLRKKRKLDEMNHYSPGGSAADDSNSDDDSPRQPTVPTKPVRPAGFPSFAGTGGLHLPALKTERHPSPHTSSGNMTPGSPGIALAAGPSAAAARDDSCVPTMEGMTSPSYSKAYMLSMGLSADPMLSDYAAMEDVHGPLRSRTGSFRTHLPLLTPPTGTPSGPTLMDYDAFHAVPAASTPGRGGASMQPSARAAAVESAAVPAGPAGVKASPSAILDAFARLNEAERLFVLEEICSSGAAWNTVKKFVIEQSQRLAQLNYESE